MPDWIAARRPLATWLWPQLLTAAATSAGASSTSGFALGTGLLGVAIGGYWLYRRRP